MNFLSHGRNALHDPWLLAGTQLPDWLSASDRRSRLVRERVLAAVAHDDGPTRMLAAGVRAHLDDDVWFHGSAAFFEVNGELTRRIRARFSEDRRLRASFLGHVLLEVLLDAHLMERHSGMIDRYYEVLAQVDGERVRALASAWTTEPPRRLGELIERFRRSEFLRGYASDEGVVLRLDGLLSRVRQPMLPPGFVELLPSARRLVYERADDLLTPPGAASTPS